MLNKAFRDLWVLRIESQVIAETVAARSKNDHNGADAGIQVDYGQGIFVYENYGTLVKRAKVWCRAHLSTSDIRAIINSKKSIEGFPWDEIVYVEAGSTNAEKIDRIIDTWGIEHGHYERIHTLPDGSVYLKLKSEFR